MLGLVVEVGVGVEGDAGAGVAEDAADVGDVEFEVDDEVACEGVSEVVDAEAGFVGWVEAGINAAVVVKEVLPSFTRFDGAVFFTLNPKWKLQLNVENIFDRKYVLTADGNNNISPGSPRAFRAALTANF